MEDKVLFIRSFIPDLDGKFSKYQRVMLDENIPWFFLGWDRTGNFQSKYQDHCFLYRKKAWVGGGWKNILNIILWNLYVAYFIYKRRKEVNILHIVDFDSAIFSYPLARLLGKKLIFDVYDQYTSMRKFPSFLKKIIDIYERYMIKNADLSILADESRVEQHQIERYENLLILENVPTNIDFFDKKENIIGGNLLIGYFGVLEKNNRGLEDTIEAIIKLENWELHVVGYGELEKLFIEKSKQYPDKIKFYGPQDSMTGLSIMQNMDLLIGFYYRNIPNHLFAAPNKYFEHLMLGKAFLTTEGTPPGKKTRTNDSGWSIAEGSASILNTLKSIDRNELKMKASNAKDFWNQQYTSYYELYYREKYGNIISTLLKSR